MSQRDNILQELNELGSSLINTSPANVYNVPNQYFEGLAAEIMARIKALEFLDAISREEPYKVPAGYFDGLEKRLMDAVLRNEAEQTPEEELKGLSPLLSSLKKDTPYSVPKGYFETLEVPANGTTKEQAKVVSFTSRKWFRYAAAAVVTGFVALGGFLIFGNNKAATNADDIVQQTIKTVGEKDIKSFIELTSEETPQYAQHTSPEIIDLVKTMSDEDIEDFVEDAQAAESDLSEDILLN